MHERSLGEVLSASRFCAYFLAGLAAIATTQVWYFPVRGKVTAVATAGAALSRLIGLTHQVGS